MAMDVPRVREVLTGFIEMATVLEEDRLNEFGGLSEYLGTRATEDDIVAAAQVVEPVLDRLVRDWRSTIPHHRRWKWQRHREAALRAVAQLDRADEVRQMLGDDAPTLDAGTFHPWVWQGARSLWASGHYADAVAAAARKVNAETQNKVARRDVSEEALFKEAFTTTDPVPGKPRLRLSADDGSKTYASIHRGTMALAEGLYAALRNPLAHEAAVDLPEDEALEQLAAFSVLARRVAAATVVTA